MLFRILEFVLQSNGSAYTRTHVASAPTQSDAVNAFEHETQRKCHGLMYVTTEETARRMGSVMADIEEFKSWEMSEQQMETWRRSNDGAGWNRCVDVRKD